MTARVVVVGSGLIGSAAARHCVDAGHRVTLIGPVEPSEFAPHYGPFASHFDEGRLTRITDNDPQWASWAKSSIDRYDDIARRSGIDFYTPMPLVYVTPDADENFLVAQSCGSRVSRVDAGWARSEYGLRVPPHLEDSIILERAPAGHINPRLLVAAQRKLAGIGGATIVEAEATRVEASGAGFRVSFGEGDSLEGDSVILATGAYGASLAGLDLAFERRLRTVALIETSERLPGLIINELNRERLDNLYWVSPVFYANGKRYLKVGGEAAPTVLASDNEEIDRWFRSGGLAAEATTLVDAVRELLPDLRINEVDHKPCVVATTPTGRPYLGETDGGLIVAIGGSGAAAKSSDEIGRQAAKLV